MVKYSINNISKTIEAVFLELGTTNVLHKRNKMTPIELLPWQQFCRWSCLNKNWNFQFCLKLAPSTAANSMIRIKTIWELCSPSRTLCLTLKAANGNICFFMTQRDWSWKSCYGDFVPFVMHICGAKFLEHCFNISRDIFYYIFYMEMLTNGLGHI